MSETQANELLRESHYHCSKCGKKWIVYEKDYGLDTNKVCSNCSYIVTPISTVIYCDSEVSNWLFWDQVEDQIEEDKIVNTE